MASLEKELPNKAVSTPRPVRILKPTADRTFELDTSALEQILLQDRVRDKKVVVLSVAGAFRKGKSFLLGFLLRYLQRGASEGWMGGDDEELTGFTWRGGAERETTGILMWSEPFLIETSKDEKVAVLLMDTQGAFDNSSTVKDCATIFALSTMTSSVQIFNISSNLQEDHLQHLQLFTEYGRLAAEEGNQEWKPFQRLEFLIRDWSYPYEHAYGDGAAFLEKRLSVDAKLHPELQQTRQHVDQCFDKVGCYLMPHPGKTVATNPRFRGQLKDIDDEFKECLREFVPRLLSPQNLVVKSVNGCDIRCFHLFHYIQSYVKIFQGGELPEPRSMLQATAEANNLAALATAKDRYQRDMELFCGGDTPYLSPQELQNKSDTLKYKAQTLFSVTRRMGSPEFCKEYGDRLGGELDQIYQNFAKLNESKDLFNTLRTPLVYVIIVVASHIASGCLSLVGLRSLASLCSVLFGAALLAAFGWIYVRFSGELRDVGEHLDAAAEWIWKEVMLTIHAFAVHHGSDSLVTQHVMKLRKFI